MKKAAGGDMTLESRHLVGLFLGVVVLCGVFFTLGYVMGRSQPGANVMAANLDAVPPASAPADPSVKPADAKPSVPSPAEWSFPAAAEPAKPAAKLEKPSVELRPPSDTVRPPAVTSAPVKSAASTKSQTAAPRMAKGSMVLQIAALTRESDALVLADALQRKGFPSFVSHGADNLYRVQVGPYSDSESADLAKAGLKREGFKAIVKR